MVSTEKMMLPSLPSPEAPDEDFIRFLKKHWGCSADVEACFGSVIFHDFHENRGTIPMSKTLRLDFLRNLLVFEIQSPRGFYSIFGDLEFPTIMLHREGI